MTAENHTNNGEAPTTPEAQILGETSSTSSNEAEADTFSDQTLLREKITELETAIDDKKTEVNQLENELRHHQNLLLLSRLHESPTGAGRGHQGSSAGHETEVVVPHRTADNVNLHIMLQAEGNVPKSTYNFLLPAAGLDTLDKLREQIVAKGTANRALQRMTLWEDQHVDSLMRDLDHVTFKLEEDGYAATMNITPTTITRRNAFPETEYAVWYYRAVHRGRHDVYTINVYIKV